MIFCHVQLTNIFLVNLFPMSQSYSNQCSQFSMSLIQFAFVRTWIKQWQQWEATSQKMNESENAEKSDDVFGCCCCCWKVFHFLFCWSSNFKCYVSFCKFNRISLVFRKCSSGRASTIYMHNWFNAKNKWNSMHKRVQVAWKPSPIHQIQFTLTDGEFVW